MHTHTKEFNGFLIADDRNTKPKALAELFCDMYGDEQAAFFNEVQRLASEWLTPNMQWRGMEKYLDPKAREMLKEMHDHTGDD